MVAFRERRRVGESLTQTKEGTSDEKTPEEMAPPEEGATSEEMAPPEEGATVDDKVAPPPPPLHDNGIGGTTLMERTSFVMRSL